MLMRSTARTVGDLLFLLTLVCSSALLSAQGPPLAVPVHYALASSLPLIFAWSSSYPPCLTCALPLIFAWSSSYPLLDLSSASDLCMVLFLPLA